MGTRLNNIGSKIASALYTIGNGLDFSETMDYGNVKPLFESDDGKALASDWDAVGKSLNDIVNVGKK